MFSIVPMPCSLLLHPGGSEHLVQFRRLGVILYLSFCFWCGSQFCLLSLQVWFPATVSWCCANRHFLPICLGLMDVTHCGRHPLLATGARAQCRLGHQISSFLSGGQFRLSAAKPLHHLPCEGLRSMPRPRPLCWASSCFVWLQGCQTMILVHQYHCSPWCFL